jgi:hypothetical protein
MTGMTNSDVENNTGANVLGTINDVGVEGGVRLRCPSRLDIGIRTAVALLN